MDYPKRIKNLISSDHIKDLQYISGEGNLDERSFMEFCMNKFFVID